MQQKKNFKDLIKTYNINPKKSLWQNYLIDENILDEIVSSTNIKWENILEIWPWFWALTERIISNLPKSLNLVEIDTKMIDIIQDRINKKDLIVDKINFEIHNEDILKFETKFKNNSYIVIANIPYYITSAILYKFLYTIKNKAKKMLIMMQKDVADKIMIWQNNNQWKIKTSFLSLYIWKKTHVKSICFVSKNCFYPAPKVDSEVLLFDTHNNYNDVKDEDFLDFLKIWFSKPRKKLINNLEKKYSKGLILEIFDSLNIKEKTRWEELDLDSWINLFKKLKEN